MRDDGTRALQHVHRNVSKGGSHEGVPEQRSILHRA